MCLSLSWWNAAIRQSEIHAQQDLTASPHHWHFLCPFLSLSLVSLFVLSSSYDFCANTNISGFLNFDWPLFVLIACWLGRDCRVSHQIVLFDASSSMQRTRRKRENKLYRSMRNKTMKHYAMTNRKITNETFFMEEKVKKKRTTKFDHEVKTKLKCRLALLKVKNRFSVICFFLTRVGSGEGDASWLLKSQNSFSILLFVPWIKSGITLDLMESMKTE